MKYRLLLTLLASSVLLLGSVSAKAGLIDINGGTFGTIPGGATNDVIESIYGTGITTRDGYFGSQLTAGADNLIFSLEYLGKEADFVNTFEFNGSEIFNTSTSAVGDTAGTFSLGLLFGDLIPFLFTVDSDADNVANGSNPDDSAGTSDFPNFFVSCDSVASATNCDSLVIFLDDAGAGPDDNHDDLALRLTARVAPVPEPMTLALLGLGLLGVSFTSRKKA